MIVLLTPSQNTKTWYYADTENYTLTIFSSRPTQISYRLTAPRFDAEIWTNARTSLHSGYILNDPDINAEINDEGYYEVEIPEIAKEEDEEYIYNGNLDEYKSEILSQNYITTFTNGDIIEEIGMYAGIIASKIKAGLIETEDLVVNKALIAKNIATEQINAISSNITNLTSRYITVEEKIISPVIETENIKVANNADISEISTNTLSLDTNLVNGYDGTTQKIMVQRVPNYTNVTVNSGYTLTASAWDGTKGGVLLFKANGTLTVTGSISVDELGLPMEYIQRTCC